MANTLQTIGNILDTTQRLYDNIRTDGVSDGYVYGLLAKSYPSMRWTLDRNHWNGFSGYDGYGTPIGSAAQVNYVGNAETDENNENGRENWIGDKWRAANENYLMYITDGYSSNIGDSDKKYRMFEPIKGGEAVGVVVPETESEYVDAYQRGKVDGKIPYSGLNRYGSDGADTVMGDIGAVALGRTYIISKSQVDDDGEVGYLTSGRYGIGDRMYWVEDKNNAYKDEDGEVIVAMKSLFFRPSYKRKHYSPDWNYLNTLADNDNGDARGVNYVYAEPENENLNSYDEFADARASNDGSMRGLYEAFQVTDWDNIETDDIITKTNKAFHADRNGRTIIGRFHTDKWSSDDDDVTSTAGSKYGFSHGRNLLKVKPTNDNGYDNPYCRVWTFHHQYSRLADCIRPFVEEDENHRLTIAKEDAKSWGDAFRSKVGGFENGGVRLFNKGVLNRANGLVNYAPSNGNGDMKSVDPRNCMFSIENLAWKGVGTKSTDNPNGLSREQRGPFGGRIMWFPPYNLTFNENVNTDWGGTSFIGRGEKVYTYKNTDRTGNIGFDILIDHPEIMNEWKNARKATVNGDDSVDNIESHEQTVLRFFAGCANLDVDSIAEPYKGNDKEGPSPKTDKGGGQHDIKVEYFLFYPNNYSGADDGTELAWQYLMNGIGYGDIVNDTAEETSQPDLYKKDPSYGIFDLSNEFYYKGDRVGGYEMWHGGEGKSKERVGVSLDTNIKSPTVTRGIISESEDADGFIAFVAKEKKDDPRDSVESRAFVWRYRVDERTRHEILRKENYRDTKTYGLNSINHESLCDVFKDVDKKDLFSATEVYKALTDAELDEESYDSERVEALKKILSEHKIDRVESYGWASSHGYVSSNEQLGKDRANTAMNIIKGTRYDNDGIRYERKSNDIGPVRNSDSVSEFNPKVYRCAHVVIYFKTEGTDELSDTVREEATYTNEADGSKVNGRTNVLISDKKSQPNRGSADRDDLKWLRAEPNKLGRYDNEGRFFQLLEVGNPFLYSKIIEKVRYFSPAYHSVSPEGFNARLTFLHQCTRQGPTVGSIDSQNSNNASNLAFGRAPVCVLRIGDFFYTKVIITSLAITYDKDGISWDMNHEGIGVMPMYAHVDIGITFLGGSDLSGPINRLQNATSFNYYANTGVYDNRSDMVEFDSDGKIGKISVYNPQVDKPKK